MRKHTRPPAFLFRVLAHAHARSYTIFFFFLLAYSQNEGALAEQLGRQLAATEAETAAREAQNAQLMATVRELQV